jgi:DNA polymerase-3 subunit epsilon
VKDKPILPPDNRFTVIDVETANHSFSSICQVGIGRFEDGQLTYAWKNYVDPEDYFDPVNVSIHGIDEKTVAEAPTWPDIHDKIVELLQGQIVVCHTAFDRSAVRQVCARYSLHTPESYWLDSSRVVRRAWPEQFGYSGYGLGNVAEYFGIEFKHHDALEDALCAGAILLKAIDSSGISLQDWFDKVNSAIGGTHPEEIRFEGNPDAVFYGETVVFTGALTLTRREAAQLAAVAGCAVVPHVTQHTTILVVGNQDISRLAGKREELQTSKGRSSDRSGPPDPNHWRI